MAKFSNGGIIPGHVYVQLFPGPLREAVNPGIYESYADECYLSPDGVCVRKDDWHRSVPIQVHRWWICPAHD